MPSSDPGLSGFPRTEPITIVMTRRKIRLTMRRNAVSADAIATKSGNNIWNIGPAELGST